MAHYCRDFEPGDVDVWDAAADAVDHALEETWTEGLSRDAWVSAAQRRLSHRA